VQFQTPDLVCQLQPAVIVMGFSSERGVGEMLHSFGHRAESILTQVFAKTQGKANLYAQFALYDKIRQAKPRWAPSIFPECG